MKVRALARTSAQSARETVTGVHVVPRNIDPALHPMARAREYTRAVVSAKMDRMFAKPFVGAMQGHRDGVYALSLAGLDTLYSGSADGELRAWSLSTRKGLFSMPRAHEGTWIRGVATVPMECSAGSEFSTALVSVASDGIIKLWRHKAETTEQDEDEDEDERDEDRLRLHVEYAGRDSAPLNSVSHHARVARFASGGGAGVDIWDHMRTTPVTSYDWGSHTVTSVRFNQAETSVLASTASDRAIVLYDIRTSAPLHRTVLAMNSNAVCWNPMEPMIFGVANEDHNCYLFDMRRLTSAVNVLRDHVSSVLDLDFSPTGAEVVTGSYDRTIRLFNVREGGRSRDVYHLRRMQRVWAVRYSPDAKYVLAGSDDGNIRVWKSLASEKLGALSARESTYVKEQKALREKFEHLPEVRKIAKHRILPGAIQKATKLKRTMLQAEKRKQENVRKNAGKRAEELHPRVPERVKSIVRTEE